MSYLSHQSGHALQVDAVQRKLSAQQQHLHAQAKEERNRLQQQVQAALMHVVYSRNRSPCAHNDCTTTRRMCGLLNELPVAFEPAVVQEALLPE